MGMGDMLMGNWGAMYVSELLNMKSVQHIENFRAGGVALLFSFC